MKLIKRLFVSAIVIIAVFGVLSSCDSGLLITEITVNKTPVKTEYILGQDTEINLDGLSINLKTKDGNITSEEWNKETMGCYSVTHDIDFNKVGEYAVHIRRNNRECSFTVYVVNGN